MGDNNFIELVAVLFGKQELLLEKGDFLKLRLGFNERRFHMGSKRVKLHPLDKKIYKSTNDKFGRYIYEMKVLLLDYQI